MRHGSALDRGCGLWPDVAMTLMRRLILLVRCLFGHHRPIEGRVRRIRTHSWTGYCIGCGARIRKDEVGPWRRWTPPPEPPQR